MKAVPVVGWFGFEGTLGNSVNPYSRMFDLVLAVSDFYHLKCNT